MNDYLKHYGVLGMKWGVRRNRPTSGSGKRGEKNGSDEKKLIVMRPPKPSTASSKPKRPSISDMSDDELRRRISRLEMEKRYKDLSREREQKRVSRGKRFVQDVMEKSGRNIATQVATYAMGAAVNKAVGKDIVNPKKGQKDK